MEERARGGRLRAANRWKDWYRERWQQACELLREREEEYAVELQAREEELARVRRTIEVTQPQPAGPSRPSSPAPPADVPEPDDVPAPRPLSVAEQQAVELGLGGPCWWEDLPERRARHEARRRDRYRTV